MTANGYMILQGGSSTQRTNIVEVYMGGLGTSSAPSAMIVARDSQVATGTLSGGFIASLDPATANLAAMPTNGIAANTTQPQRSATLQLLQVAFNMFGGVVRWVAAPGEEIGMLGNTASNGEISLSALNTGTQAAMSSHFIFEPF
jgi:hypothetical protein